MSGIDSGEKGRAPGAIDLDAKARALQKKPELKAASEAAVPELPLSEPALSEPGSLVGQTIDSRFKVGSRLGKGAMGEVYKAEHLILQKTVAVKVLHKNQQMQGNAVERFRQEAKAISALDHANIVRVFAFGAAEGERLYLVMDYLDGKSLSEILEESDRLEFRRAIDLALQIAGGLAHAHERGVIHRDLKPSNIIIETDAHGKENAKIVDFGVARLTSESGKEVKQLTRTGNTCGSPAYMSPEQCLGDKVDSRSDIYSLGCMLYECLTGKRPFYGKSAMDVMQMHLEQSPAFFNSRLQIPQSLEAIVRKCLNKKAEDRYQSMQELASDLEIVGSQTAKEDALNEAFKNEWRNKTRLRRLLTTYGLIALSLILLCCVAALFSYQFLPQCEYFRLTNEYKNITGTDPRRVNRVLAILPRMIELEIKDGNEDLALDHVTRLESEVKNMPMSVYRCRLQKKLARYYLKLGKKEEAGILINQTIAALEKYIETCNIKNRFDELEAAAIEVVRLCGKDRRKLDHALGQLNLLCHAYIWKREFKKAELVAKQALDLMADQSCGTAALEIDILESLAGSLSAQSNFSGAEAYLEKSLDLCRKNFGDSHEYTRKIAGLLVGCYLNQAKTQDAERLSKLLGLK